MGPFNIAAGSGVDVGLKDQSLAFDKSSFFFMGVNPKDNSWTKRDFFEVGAGVASFGTETATVTNSNGSSSTISNSKVGLLFFSMEGSTNSATSETTSTFSLDVSLPKINLLGITLNIGFKYPIVVEM